jgi:hypothetical protein
MMDVGHVLPPIRDRLIARFTVNGAFIRKIGLQHLIISLLIAIFGQLFFNLKSIVILNYLNQVKVSFWDQLLKEDRQQLILIRKLD